MPNNMKKRCKTLKLVIFTLTLMHAAEGCGRPMWESSSSVEYLHQSELYFYFEDEGIRYDMSATLTWKGNNFFGMGTDRNGLFAISKGQINPGNGAISFEKNSISNPEEAILFEGTCLSLRTPLQAKGEWKSPKSDGMWSMSLLGSPSHGALPSRNHPTWQTWEEWGHTILEFVPVPFVATSYNCGSAFFYALTGNAAKAHERLYDAAFDASFDVIALVTGGAAEIGKIAKAEEEALRGGEKIYQYEKKVLLEESHNHELSFNPMADSVEEKEAIEGTKCKRSVRRGSGTIGMVGTYCENKPQHSLAGITEANHLPPASTTQGTVYGIGGGNLLTMSTEYELHQALFRTVGTTGSSSVAKFLRSIIRNLLLKKDLQTALKLQILSEYGHWGAIERYAEGIKSLIKRYNTVLRTDGIPFLSGQEKESMLQWFDDLLSISKDSSDDNTSWEHIFQEMLRIIKLAE